MHHRSMDCVPNAVRSPFLHHGSLLPFDCMTILHGVKQGSAQCYLRNNHGPHWGCGHSDASEKDCFSPKFGHGSCFGLSQLSKDSLKASQASAGTLSRAFFAIKSDTFMRSPPLTSVRVSANDSSQHGTAEPVSEEEQSRGLDGHRVMGTPSEMSGSRPEGPDCTVEGAETSSEFDMEGFVLGIGQADAWDSLRIGSPVVRRYLSDNEERWLMWYSGRAVDQQDSEGNSKMGTECVGLAISSNGIHWERGNAFVENNEHGSEAVGKVLDCSSNWWAFDTEIIRPSDVLVLSSLKVRATAGVYWMYYTGGCSEVVEIPHPERFPFNVPGVTYKDEKVSFLRTRPGLVLSHDGRNWARIEGDHHSGSLFDVGSENEWDSLYIAAPHVVYFNADDLRMYYHSFDSKAGCFAVGIARSRDGMKWVKLGKILAAGAPGSFDELGVKYPQVVPHPDGKGYLMIYEGVAADGSSNFGLARSHDGLSLWERCSDKPVFTRAVTRNAWDGKEIHCPCLVHMEDQEWCLYYEGVDHNGKSGIGMAICADGKLLNFQRCHGLHF